MLNKYKYVMLVCYLKVLCYRNDAYRITTANGFKTRIGKSYGEYVQPLL